MKLRLSIITALALLLAACQETDLALEPSVDELAAQVCDVMIDGLDQTVALPLEGTGTVVSVAVEEGDFLTALPGGQLYAEQNDDGRWRRGVIRAQLSDGTSRRLTLAQKVPTRAEVQSQKSFYRHHALGYSYDAVAGSYCELKDVRCQVLNRAVVEMVEKKDFRTIFTEDYLHDFKASSSVSTSVVDYVQNSNFQAKAGASIALLGSTDAKGFCHIFEDGIEDTYILHDERELLRAHYTLQIGNIQELIKKYPTLLTSSFRKSIEELAATDKDNWKAVDDFINIYGTHVVNSATLGARLSVDVQVKTNKFVTTEEESLLADATIATLFKISYSTEAEDKNYQMLRDCKCRVEVLGGDVSALDKLVSRTFFTNDDITPDLYDTWEKSVKFDGDDIANSNVEMTDMEVWPIWELVPDKSVADRLQARIQADAAIMLQLLGNRNFLNAKFPYPISSVTCRIGNQRNQKFDNPDVTDVIVDGRHVATVCREMVPAISKTEYVQVAYPIYEGRVKLTNGLCVHDGKTYSVDWRNDHFKVNEVDGLTTGDGNMYLTGGVLSTSSFDQVDYQTGHLVLGCERPGGIAINGSLAGKMVKVQKHFGHFYLVDDKNYYGNLPNWSYVTSAPAEASDMDYKDYFPQGAWQNRMVRDASYVYIFNTTELGYE